MYVSVKQYQLNISHPTVWILYRISGSDSANQDRPNVKFDESYVGQETLKLNVWVDKQH